MIQDLKQILPFLILMGGKDILSKSPTYIIEKFVAASDSSDAFRLLDSDNQKILMDYLLKWHCPINQWLDFAEEASLLNI
jgi:hypothetical protein